MKYIAVQGDTWDSISYKIYGDEFLFVDLLSANRDKTDIILFDGGEEVYIPDQIVVENQLISTPWATGATISIIESPWG